MAIINQSTDNSMSYYKNNFNGNGHPKDIVYCDAKNCYTKCYNTGNILGVRGIWDIVRIDLSKLM